VTDEGDDDWSAIDWAGLERLLAGFIDAPATTRGAALADYWRDERLLRSYDLTFGARIGWKWDAVLAELEARGVVPPAGAHLYDWGTGSGVAARRWIAAWGAGGLAGASLWDRSATAVRYASRRLQAAAPDLRLSPWRPGDGLTRQPAILLVSHVLTELDAAARQNVIELARGAQLVVWVEPGAPGPSRELIAAREALRGELVPIAPCTHAGACGLTTPENARHWCHNFAAPPQAVFREARWRALADRLGIDLRSLPVSYLAMARRAAAEDPEAGRARVIGRVREYKGHHKLLACDATGVAERVQQQRDDKALFKSLSKGAFAAFLPPRSE
jgi:hypothetical protein